MSEHAKTLPWSAINGGVDIVDNATCSLIANVWAQGENRGGPKAQEYAAFIVKAVNNHAPALKSLEHCASLFDLLAQTMDRWAFESREGGWSTHQVADNRKRADDCRRYAAHLRESLASVGSIPVDK